MDSTTIRRGVDVAMCLAALAATWMLARILPGVGAVAPISIAFATAIVLLSIVDGERSPVSLGVPALMLVLLVMPGNRERLLASGLVLATCLAIAGWRWVSSGRITLPRGVVLLVAALAPAAAFPLTGDGLAAAVLAGAGAIAIVGAAAEDRRVGIDVVMVAYCAALASPAVPFRSSLFAFVLAALILLARRPGPFSAGLFLLLVLAAGKWYLPLVLAVAAGFAAQRWRVARDGSRGTMAAVATPAMPGIPSAAIASLAIAPDVWAGVRKAGVVAGLSAVLLAAGSLVVQPSLATIYAISAVACLVAAGRGEAWSVTLTAFALVMSGLTAWSGVVSGAFPLPVPVVVILVIAAAAWIGGSARADAPGLSGRAASAIMAGLAALAVLLHPALGPERRAIASDLRIESGDSVSIPVPPDASGVRLEVSGGNVAGLESGTVVAVVRAEPGGESRELRIGDFADWGARRREHWLTANNPRPLETAGPVLGEGRAAFLSGAGVVRLETRGAESLTIEVLPAIGESGRLLVAAVEAEK